MAKRFLSYFAYIGVALLGGGLALFLTTQLLSDAHSQAPEAGVVKDVPVQGADANSNEAPPLGAPEEIKEGGAQPPADQLPPPSGANLPPDPSTEQPTELGAPTEIPTDPSTSIPPNGLPDGTIVPTPPGEAPNGALTKDEKDVLDKEQVLKNAQPLFYYDPRGRRDPFKPFSNQAFGDGETPESELEPLQRFDLEQLRVSGVIWNVKRPKVMVVDPSGEVHIVEKDAKLGRNSGYIAVIREGEVVVVETYEDEGQIAYNTRVLTISP